MTISVGSQRTDRADPLQTEAPTQLAMGAQLQRLWQEVFDQSRVIRADSGEFRLSPDFTHPPVRAGNTGDANKGWHTHDRHVEERLSVDARVASRHTPEGHSLRVEKKALPRPALATSGDGRGQYNAGFDKPTFGAAVELTRSTLPATEAAKPHSGIVFPSRLLERAGISAAQLPVPEPIASRSAVLQDLADSLHIRSVVEPRGHTASTSNRDGESNIDHSLPDEVVQVFNHKGAIEIVIRDSSLHPEAALRCALETARQIAGDTRALRHVTLNGRAVFDRGTESGETFSHALVSFSC